MKDKVIKLPGVGAVLFLVSLICISLYHQQNNQRELAILNKVTEIRKTSTYVYLVQDESIQIHLLDTSEEREPELKIQELLNVLSKHYGLPIQLECIEKVDGQQIAIVNLKEHDNKDYSYNNLETELEINESSWYLLAQGSSGSSSVVDSIVETVLQRQWDGEWISGVKLIYNGQDDVIVGHIECFGEVFYK